MHSPIFYVSENPNLLETNALAEVVSDWRTPNTTNNLTWHRNRWDIKPIVDNYFTVEDHKDYYELNQKSHALETYVQAIKAATLGWLETIDKLGAVHPEHLGGEFTNNLYKFEKLISPTSGAVFIFIESLDQTKNTLYLDEHVIGTARLLRKDPKPLFISKLQGDYHY